MSEEKKLIPPSQERLDDFLRRLSEWDVLNPTDPKGDDSTFWKGEIEKARKDLEELASEMRLRLLMKDIDYAALNDWASRMPDAGFNSEDPRWAWWHERPRAQERSDDYYRPCPNTGILALFCSCWVHAPLLDPEPEPDAS
jgi:hypothetical protein